MQFWIAAAGLVAVILALFLLALRHNSQAAAEDDASDLAVYRDQLAEVERDLSRGTIQAAEAERLRTEISRRLLEADRQAQGAARSGRGNFALGAALAVAMIAPAFWLYQRLGAPSYPDMPLAARISASNAAMAARPSQADLQRAARAASTQQTDPEYAELLAKLRQTVAERPDDIQGQMLLARNETAVGNFVAAAQAQAQVLRLKGAEASAADHSAFADLMILAAGGAVSGEAQAALAQALTLDPHEPTARFYSGLLLIQTGRPDIAFEIWRSLLEDSPPDAPWVPTLRAELPDLAWFAGTDYAPPAETTVGPSAEDMAAAADLSEEDRDEMVRGMVDRLSSRLAREGGSAEEWARLIGALKVLGEDDRAREILAEAKTVFYDRPEDAERIRAAAEAAGLE